MSHSSTGTASSFAKCTSDDVCPPSSPDVMLPLSSDMEFVRVFLSFNECVCFSSRFFNLALTGDSFTSLLFSKLTCFSTAALSFGVGSQPSVFECCNLRFASDFFGVFCALCSDAYFMSGFSLTGRLCCFVSSVGFVPVSFGVASVTFSFDLSLYTSSERDRFAGTRWSGEGDLSFCVLV